ncbi:hypothetical protein ACVINH_001781 [Rhizobium anhuiense]
MPNKDLARLIEAADRLAAGGFTMGADWQAVHEICQRHEGEQPFDWGHALCHRIEGDDWRCRLLVSSRWKETRRRLDGRRVVGDADGTLCKGWRLTP